MTPLIRSSTAAFSRLYLIFFRSRVLSPVKSSKEEGDTYSGKLPLIGIERYELSSMIGSPSVKENNITNKTKNRMKNLRVKRVSI